MVKFVPYIKSDFLNMKVKDFAKLIHGKNKSEFVQIIKTKNQIWFQARCLINM